MKQIRIIKIKNNNDLEKPINNKISINNKIKIKNVTNSRVKKIKQRTMEKIKRDEIVVAIRKTNNK